MIKYIANGTEKVAWGDTLGVGHFDFTEINSLYTINSVKSGTLPPFVTLTNDILLSDSDLQVKGRWVVVFNVMEKATSTLTELQIDFRCHEFFPTVISPYKAGVSWSFIRGRGDSREWENTHSQKSTIQHNGGSWEIAFPTSTTDLGSDENPRIKRYSGIATGTFRSNKTVFVLPLIPNSMLASRRYEAQLSFQYANDAAVIVDWGDGTVEEFTKSYSPEEFVTHNYSTSDGFEGTFFVTVENHKSSTLYTSNNLAYFKLQVADSEMKWFPNRYTPSHLVLPDSVVDCSSTWSAGESSFDFNCLFDDWYAGDRNISCLFAGHFNNETGLIEDTPTVTGTVRWNPGVNFKHPFFAFSGCTKLTNYASLPSWMVEKRYAYTPDAVPVKIQCPDIVEGTINKPLTPIEIGFKVDNYSNAFSPSMCYVEGEPTWLSLTDLTLSGTPDTAGEFTCTVKYDISPFSRKTDTGTNAYFNKTITFNIKNTINTGTIGLKLGDIFYKLY